MRLLPYAVWKPIKYRSEAGIFVGTPKGWILHSAEMNGSPFNLFNNLKSTDRGGRRFSTAWISKTGAGEQFTELESKSWAQNYGNPFYWAIEFEGFAAEPLTTAQIHTASLWHSFLGAQNKLANAPGEYGIGIHSMGNRLGWLPTACPGSIRAAQRSAILGAVGGNPTPVATKPVVTLSAPAWPLSPLHYFGVFSATNDRCHSGTYSPADRENIKDYQIQMAHRGWKISTDGIFGTQTALVTTQFQIEKHITVDSKVGQQTWKAAWNAAIT